MLYCLPDSGWGRKQEQCQGAPIAIVFKKRKRRAVGIACPPNRPFRHMTQRETRDSALPSPFLLRNPKFSVPFAAAVSRCGLARAAGVSVYTVYRCIA